MRFFLRLAAGLGLFLGAAATALGLLAPWLPAFELINHFRPFLLAGLLPVVAASWASGSRLFIRCGTVLMVFTMVLTLLPLAYRAGRAEAVGDGIKIVSMNVWVGNRDVEATARFLEGEAADIVVLQEADRMHRPLMERLSGTYPHAYCPDRACSVALLSRTAWIEAGKEDVPPRRPLLIWARFATRDGRTYRVIGTHLPYPFEYQRQAEHTDWLISYLQRQTEPLVVAGDFNLTPFSWKMTKLLHEAGLSLHLLYGFTWPANRLVPVVLLDNVLTTPDFAAVSARAGHGAGSDHRPVIVEFSWR